MAEGHGKKVSDRATAAGFLIFYTVNDPANASVDNGAGTHGTWFQGDVEFTIGQTPAIQCPTGILDRQNFRVADGG